MENGLGSAAGRGFGKVSSKVAPQNSRGKFLRACLGKAALVAVALAVSAPLANAAEPLTFINLQLNPWSVVAQEKGIFKEEFDKIGVKEVNLIASGAAELSGAESAGLNRGSIAIAQRMLYPATAHRANGLDAVVVWVSEASNKYRTPLLARADNNEVNSIADMEGKVYGSNRIGCSYTSVFESFEAAGLPLDTRLKAGKIRYEGVENNGARNAALLSGAVDGLATHIGNNSGAALYLSGKVKIVGRTVERGVYENGAGRVSFFAMRDFAEQYPEAVKAFLISYRRATAWIQDNVDEAAAIISKGTRVPLDIAKFQIVDPSGYEFIKGDTSADNVRKAIGEFQDWYIAHGDDVFTDRKLSQQDIATFVDGKFFKGGEYSIY
ncbi:ABC-type nitrate/sulfonate/bicarbonate transport system substrate-binding protein [Ancylobacter sp. 3268]|uniref:ABC transporter substrate-binding protein n=1 Tax=Ancylobacter sp. 3268 TaxID=2817752 RepID=UPI002854DCEE|nr:ABC transporter substrate-binding protein [Ancylobacter sp. 3268]MDR6951324.1 ABC-type nitrate/sulfonate/bicarbonate transport system substrate-binding protein [Ancylobacter sp. 3268]